ncbi:MAG TPA: TonB-dependent receptor, partial [Ignavibacteria bacterium]|nr:TonB-dependent receptor [Ignavibacteria bacterium]
FEGSMKQLPNISFRMQGTLKRAGNISAPDYTLKNTGYEENNFSLGLGYDKDGEIGIEGFYSQFNTKIGIFPGAHIGNLTDLQNAFKRKIPFYTGGFSYDIGRPYQDIHHDLFKLKGYLVTGKDTRLTADYSWQYNERSEFDNHTPSNPALLSQPELFFGITTYSGDVMLEHRNLGPFKGKTGLSIMRQTNLAKGRDFIPNFENYSGGIYAIEQTNIGMLELEAGIRYDYKWQKIYKNINGNIYSPDFSHSNFSGVLGGKYWLKQDMWFSLNLGTSWRPPSASELFSYGVHHGSASYEVGNESLTPEKSYQAIGTFHYDNEKNFHAEATLYYNYISDFIYLEPRPPAILTIRGAFPAFYYEQTNVEFKGLDADISYDIFSFLNIESKASIVRAFNLTADDYLFLIPADRFENTLTLKTGDISIFKDVSFSVSSLNVLKQTRVPANTDYVPPPDGYMLFNSDIEFTIPVGKQELRFGLSVDNIFDTSYRDYLNRFRYYTDDPGRNITLRLIVPVKF